MPPNCKVENLPITECAAPYKEEQNGSGIEKPIVVQNGNPSAFVSLRREESRVPEPNPRVNTTHQYSYELDRYRKNAMLVFHYDNVCNGSKETADKIRNTFEKFRFEVAVHQNATKNEVKAICRAFFQRDFVEYGAVGVVVIAKINKRGNFITPVCTFSDKDIMGYVKEANLQSKPKILIFESNYSGKPRNIAKVFNVADILQVDVHTSAKAKKVFQPLRFFCDHLDSLADQETLQTILKTTLSKIPVNLISSYCNNNVEVIPNHYNWCMQDTMTKRLTLWRNLNTNTN